MIIEKQKEALVLSDGEDTQESIGMTLDTESATFLMQMLSKNIYSDPIGSTIRETTSNALDSHRLAGVDKPIIVSLKLTKDGNYEFSVEDFGVGLDDIEIRQIISKYGASTKRESNVQLGAWGLGFKAPLAYSSSFYFVVRKNGIERKYMMYEGEDVNTIDLLYETVTNESNGVKVIIPVKFYDKNEFFGKIKEQLAYFESVYFDVNVNGSTIYNKFKILRTEDIQMSEMTSDSDMHICLDNVYYPLDFSKIGIPRLFIGVGLRFGLSDGIFPTVNREAIRYTEEAKVIILAKIGKAADYLISKYNETIHDTSDIFAIFNHYKTYNRNIKIEGSTYNVANLVKYGNIQFLNPNLIGVNLISLERICEINSTILKEYETKFILNNGRLREKNRYDATLSIDNCKNNTIYIFSEKIGGNKREYIKKKCSHSYGTSFVKKEKSFTLFARRGYRDENDSYYTLLELSHYSRNEWRTRIKEFQYIISLLTAKFIDLDAIVVPQDWLDARKKQRITITETGTGRRTKLQGEVFAKESRHLERCVQGKNCKFVPVTYHLEKIPIMPYLMVYTVHSDADKLDKLYDFKFKQPLRFITFSEREMKTLQGTDIHNLITYEQFMKGDNKPFKRIVSAYLIKKLKNEYKYTFSNRKTLSTISTSLMDKLNKLSKYVDDNWANTSNSVYEAMLVVAEEGKLFDMEIYNVYLDVKAILKKLKFLEPVMKAVGWNVDELIPVLCDLFKYYKFKMNYENYGVKLNEEESKEELTEIKIEQLTDTNN